jgi:glycosyltransferase involved in cell wall biosynthesis
LIIFADDWGRHPSSCQHLTRALLERYPVTWVNTIGMRRPGLSRRDTGKIAQRLRDWTALGRPANGAELPANLTVLTPLMWPGFRHAWERALNRVLVGRALAAQRAAPAERRVVMTTAPITAALLARLRADALVYYCVDDFASWPGLDGRVMRELERQLVQRADRLVAASSVLRDTLAATGREVGLLTHGVDVAHWRRSDEPSRATPPPWLQRLRRPIAVFWGLVDRRLDAGWLRALQDPRLGGGGSLVLAGPVEAPDPQIAALDGVTLPGPLAYDALPQLAALADVLVMPYADSPLSRAMQPLKLKEYLATRKPVIASALPATRAWSDACDVVDSAEAFARAAAQRARNGTPDAQLRARQRVLHESWEHKARELETLLDGCL